MMDDKGTVLGIEHIQELVDFSLNNIKKNHKDLLRNKNVQFINGDGRLGYDRLKPYHAIHVGAGN